GVDAEALVVERDADAPWKRRHVDAGNLRRTFGSVGVVVRAQVQAGAREELVNEVVCHLVPLLRAARSAVVAPSAARREFVVPYQMSKAAAKADGLFRRAGRASSSVRPVGTTLQGARRSRA